MAIIKVTFGAIKLIVVIILPFMLIKVNFITIIIDKVINSYQFQV
jgi:hypothetical protein